MCKAITLSQTVPLPFNLFDSAALSRLQLRLQPGFRSQVGEDQSGGNPHEAEEGRGRILGSNAGQLPLPTLLAEALSLGCNMGIRLSARPSPVLHVKCKPRCARLHDSTG